MLAKKSLLSHCNSLPICKGTAGQWMIKCGGSRKDSNKSYYNDQHKNPEAITYRETNACLEDLARELAGKRYATT